MKDFLQRIEKLSPKHLALLALDQHRRLEKLEHSLREPVAIVGMGCRLPGGVDSPDSFWELLAGGRDEITEIPFERWDVGAWYDPDPEVRGRISTRWGGFLRDVDRFDAAFFGISRREAVSMDPQQRLLLETSWEALEHAGVAARSLAGSRMGIFFGLSTADYYQLLMQAGLEGIDGYTATGTAHSIATGRLAYILGVHGPTLTIDTACSSSLVAVHLACQSLRAGECEMALAGGVNLILSPETSIALSQARMLAPDGRCKTFDAAADGFVRSEGCGVVVLKLISQALQDRDNILAVIRGSAVNQDGRSSGLTAPNGAAQENLIRQALEASGLTAAEVQYVEAHGTGTGLGDPIEAHALTAVMGDGRNPQNPLYVGSVKTNIGHTEAAAGVAGLIKTVLSLQHETIPASLHFSRLNPHIDLNGASLIVPSQALAWPHAERRIAGVSSFGFSGTNAHVIIEGPPARSAAAVSPGEAQVLVLSARTPAALRALAQRYEAYLEVHPHVSLNDVCYTADTGRNRFEFVAALPAASVTELRAKLAGVASGRQDLGLAAPSAPLSGNRIALPTYPFERQRYWVETRRSSQPAPEQAAVEFYKLEWERKSVGTGAEQAGGSSSNLPPGSIPAIAERVAPQFDTLGREHGLDRYGELQPELDRLSFEYIVRALRHCGWNPALGDILDVEEFAARLGVRQRYWRSLGRMLEILGEAGVLERRGRAWNVLRVPEAVDPGTDFPLLLAAYPQFSGELAFLRRCGADLGSVLQGKIDPLNLLFPDGSFDTAEDLYEKSAGAKVFQTLIQQVMAQAVERFPAGRTIRILEVGGGTGGTAAYVARVLPPGRVEYVFTDVSPLFADRGARKFQQYPFFRFEVLDLERDPEAQGFARHGFDIIIAANCVHATADLRASLNHIVRLLAPDGMLVLLEGTRSERWVDVSFGLTDGWWRFTDRDLRSDYPLVSTESWRKLLAEAGCREVTTLPSDPESQQVLLLARGPAKDREEKGWLVVAGSGRFAQAVADKFAERGESSVMVAAADPLLLPAGGWRGIVDLTALDVPGAEDLTDAQWSNAHQLGCESVLALTRVLMERGGRLWVVTRGAQRVAGESMSGAIGPAMVWGLGRSIALEQPEVWGGLVDLDPLGNDEEQAGLLVREIMAGDQEDQIAFRQGDRHAARLRPCTRPAAPPVRFQPDGCYLITGGLGGLGLVVARWMAGQGARRLVLVGRSGVTRQSQTAALREIEELGASVRIVQADIADPPQAERLFAAIAAEEPPLKGVIHAAAALSRDRVRDMPAETLREILRPKVLGTWMLHRHTRNLKLDFLCLFSSTASVLGSGGLAHYAAANQFLDAFAQYRQSLGLPAVAVDWGTWDEMRTVSEENRKQYRSLGLLPMASSQALTALGDLLQSPEPYIMAAAINWRTLRAVFEARRKRPLLEGTEPQPTPAPRAAGAADAPLWERFSAAEREARLAALIWEETCSVLQIEAGAPLEPDRGFFEMGLDSLVSVELKSRLEARLGRTIPGMMIFNFPSVRALSARLAADFNDVRPSPSGNGARAVPAPAAPDVQDDDEVARLLAEKLQSMQNRRGVLNSR